MRQVVRVLMIEPDAADAAWFHELFAGMGSMRAEIECAPRGVLGWEKVLRDGGIDAALVALLPGGPRDVEAVTRVHEVAPDVALLAVAKVEDDERARAALLAGAQDFLVKTALDSRGLERAIQFAIERTRASSERALLRARLLAEVGAVLASSPAHEENLAAMARLVVPKMGDACAIDAFSEDGTSRRIASARIDCVPASLSRAVVAVHAPAIVADGMCIVAPLLVRGRTYAVLTLERVDEARRYGPFDLALAADLADRAALATENAILRRTRDEMLTIVSHDLRNPLGVVSLSVATMRRTTVVADTKLNPVEKIRRAADQMNTLIGDLLDMSQMETGLLHIAPGPEATLPLLGEVFEAMRPLADEMQLKLVTEVTGVLPPIHVDRERVLQVLSNLISDAIVFTPVGGVVKIGAQLEGDSVKLWVSDGGPTIPEDDRARLFEQSWRAKRPGHRASGLMLPVTRGIVQAHGGQIWVSTNAAVGSTFHVTFPLSGRGLERTA